MNTFAQRMDVYSAENPYPGSSEQDRQRILTPEEIIALKDKFRDSFRSSELCGYIVRTILLETYSEEDEKQGEIGCRVSSTPQSLQGRIEQAAALGAHWGIELNRAIEFPGDAWPKDMTSPGDFAVWAEQMEAAQVSFSS